MQISLTAAATRALEAAAAWKLGDTAQPLEPPQVLLGLLGEEECRAAQLLLERGLDTDCIRRRWPELRPASPLEGSPVLSGHIVANLRAAAREVVGEREEMATEHLLLALALGDDDVARLLADAGLGPETVLADLQQRYGCEPLPRDDADAAPLELPPAPAPSEPSAPLRGELENAEASTPLTELAVTRVLDAAANRAAEGLRTVEDLVRFVLNDAHLTGLLKALRHDLAAALDGVPMVERLASRETIRDVGAACAAPREYVRQSTAQIATASFTRVEQALRTLEEFGKLRDPALGAALESLRYRAYTLHKAVGTTEHAQRSLAAARLYVLIDGRESVDAFEQLARQLIAAGVHVLQLRDKLLDDGALLDRARRLRALTQGTPTLFIMNDRADLARLAEADGVHVGQKELSVQDARAVVGPQMLVGVSTHSLAQARQAVLDGANYLGVGPTFPSGTKAFATYPGLPLSAAVAAEISLPAFAIGGIGPENLEQVLATGIGRVAVGSAVVDAERPGDVVNELREILSAAAGR